MCTRLCMVVIARRVRSSLRTLLTFSLRCEKPSVRARCVGVYRLYSRGIHTAVIAVARVNYISRTERKLCAHCKVGYSSILYVHCIVFIIMCTLHVYYILCTRVYYNNADAETKRAREGASEKPWELAVGAYNLYAYIDIILMLYIIYRCDLIFSQSR